MLDVTLTVTLVLRGPVLSQATAIGNLGFDAHMAHDPQGTYTLPFSLVRGRLRQAWEELNETAATRHREAIPTLDVLLGPAAEGPESPGMSDYRPRRGRLRMTDFKYSGDPVTPESVYRIRMDTARGSVDEGAMQIIESPFAPGQPVPFTGQIRFRAQGPQEADRIEAYIRKGLRWMPCLGAERTSGFGRLIEVKVKAAHRPMQTVSATPPRSAPKMIPIAIRPQAAFCVSSHQAAPNLFESSALIAGGVIRGALATMLKEVGGLPHDAVIGDNLPENWRALGQFFDQIRFCHAFCARQSRSLRPVVAPFSLVKDGDGHLLQDAEGHVCDVSRCETPGLIGPSRQAPVFEMDWKGGDDVNALFGWPLSGEIQRELRVRTAIDQSYRRAKDKQLFAYDMVVPDGLTWYGAIDLHAIEADEDRARVAAQLIDLLQSGLHGLGKTKVSATVETNVAHQPAQLSSRAPVDGDCWVVTLQTPSLLCDPKPLDEMSGPGALFTAYDDVWRALSVRNLKLVRFFAKQSLAGGYQVYRFQPGKCYNPFLLTEPGSVFVLRATSDIDAARAVIETWLAQGLDLPPWAQERYGISWQTCPFLRRDGFGEIAVNLPCNRRPDRENFDAI